MKIPLNEFEQLIDESILKRGFDYFNKGAVTDFSELSSGVYEAIVTGTNEYTVQLEIKNNVISKHTCDCPYDIGPVCKHVVAVIFYLQQGELELNTILTKTPRSGVEPNSTKKVKSGNQQVKELLKDISPDVLFDFVEKKCKEDKVFRNYFLASFGYLNQTQYQTKEFYQKQILTLFKSAKGKDGWIGWSEMKYVVKTIETLLENGEHYFQQKNYEDVFFFSTALLEELTKALQYSDDSNGDLGYFVEVAMKLLSRLSTVNISQSLKQQIFEYCITTFNNKLFAGWDWHLGILQVAEDYVDNEQEADRIIASLANVEGNYEKECAIVYILDLLRKFKDQKEVDEFINKHISNSAIRKQEIEKAFKNKNFDRAIQLAKDGIKDNEKNRSGFELVWYDWLLEIAIFVQDTPNIIKYARYRFIFNFGGKRDYYQILKQNIEPEKWHSFLEEIIQDVSQQGKWINTDIIRKIYIREAWWDRLLLMLKADLSLGNIEENEPYLTKDYSSELIELYRECLPNYVENNLGRNYYQTACMFLRNMKKLGGNLQVNELIEQFRNQYPKRKALMEELSKV